MKNITFDIKTLSVDDHKIDLFEGQYVVPNGMSYNSYIIFDEKIAIMDSVDKNFSDVWLENVREALNGRKPDYLVVSHMEPDHSANILRLVEEYPDIKIVSNPLSFGFMKQFFNKDFSSRAVNVKDGMELSLGKHTLKFFTASMVHWPEVIMTYDEYDKVLFTADAFGKFGASDVDEEWDCEARRYYFGIVGKYGAHVQKLLKKIEGLEINKILPLHGPVLEGDLSHYLKQYDTWSRYESEDEGVTICYTSIYGHTKEAVLLLKEELEKEGCKKVTLFDLARDDQAEAVEDSFRYSKLVLASTTYNNEIFPAMRNFIQVLVEHNYQNREIAIIENGSWHPAVASIIKKMFENSPNIIFVDPVITVKSALNDQNRDDIQTLASILK